VDGIGSLRETHGDDEAIAAESCSARTSVRLAALLEQAITRERVRRAGFGSISFAGETDRYDVLPASKTARRRSPPT